MKRWVWAGLLLAGACAVALAGAGAGPPEAPTVPAPSEWPPEMVGAPEAPRPGVPRWRRSLPRAEFLLERARQLELTDKQVQELRGLLLQSRLRQVDLEARLQKAWLMLDAALDADQVNLQEVSKLLHEAAEADAELQLADIETCVKARAVLTERQRRRLAEMPDGPPWRVTPGPDVAPGAPPAAPPLD
jgi:uncharacterized membrane protein